MELKRFLDERAGGSIEFFLSSDDESIPNGSIWPEEVKAALDRMSLMLVFISPEALDSRWIYFEAEYGLHKLNAANVFCLPGCNRDKLPSPFSVIQNRNLHTAHELSLLIREINDRLGFRLKEEVSRDEFNHMFKRRETMGLNTSLQLTEIVQNICVSLYGPPNSRELFSTTCEDLRVPTTRASDSNRGWDDQCSTGIRLKVEDPNFEYRAGEVRHRKLNEKFIVTDAIRKAKGAWFHEVSSDFWLRSSDVDAVFKTVKEIENYNKLCAKRDEQRRREYQRREESWRECIIEISPLKIEIAMAIADQWLQKIRPEKCPKTVINLKSDVRLETKADILAALIHDSDLCLNSTGLLLWKQSVEVALSKTNSYNDAAPHYTLELTMNPDSLITSLEIEELIATLTSLRVLSILGKQRRSSNWKRG